MSLLFDVIAEFAYYYEPALKFEKQKVKMAVLGILKLRI